MAVSEELQHHWLWQDKPFAKGQAWIDMLFLAANKSTFYRGKIHTHAKGQFITSENTLCERWGWSRTKVRAFLNTLAQSALLSITSTGGKTTITILQITEVEEQQTTINLKEKQDKKQVMTQVKSADNEKLKSGYIQDKKQEIILAKNEIKDRQKTAPIPQFVQLSLIDAIEEKTNEKPNEI